MDLWALWGEIFKHVVLAALPIGGSVEHGLKNMPDALKVLYIIYKIKGPIDIKDIHRIVNALSKIGVCCKQYSFARYPWGPYSRDLDIDLEILRSSGLVIISNGGSSRRLAITDKGAMVAGNIERAMDPDERERLESLLTRAGNV